MNNKNRETIQDKERKGREGIPMSEEDIKDWQKVFTDMEEAINQLMEE